MIIGVGTDVVDIASALVIAEGEPGPAGPGRV
jgi:hypothetical protein